MRAHVFGWAKTDSKLIHQPDNYKAAINHQGGRFIESINDMVGGKYQYY